MYHSYEVISVLEHILTNYYTFRYFWAQIYIVFGPHLHRPVEREYGALGKSLKVGAPKIGPTGPESTAGGLGAQLPIFFGF